MLHFQLTILLEIVHRSLDPREGWKNNRNYFLSMDKKIQIFQESFRLGFQLTVQSVPPKQG